MSHQAAEVFCSYPFSWKLKIGLAILPFTALGLLFVGVTAKWLALAVARLASGSPPGPEPLVVGAFTLCMLYGPALFTNTYSDVRVSQSGIDVQVFWLWWVFVPWENVLDIRPTWQSRLFGHRRSQLVVVRRLTVLHRCIGWNHGMTLRPAFIIRGTQTGYDEAVRFIRQRLGKQETRLTQGVA